MEANLLPQRSPLMMTSHSRAVLLGAACVFFATGLPIVAFSQQLKPTSQTDEVTDLPPALQARKVVQLGPGDGVAVSVYGQPDMTTNTSVGDDGSLTIPLIGAVQVNGLSPAEAGIKIEQALVSGKILVKPQVTVTLALSRSQRISVLGEIGVPGRYAVDASTSIFDLLAQAGGTKETGATYVYLLRPSADGKISRYTINLKGLIDEKNSVPNAVLQGGDTVYVPKAPQFYIFGEVTAPNQYRIEPGMTYTEAIVRAGGITARGSRNRLEVKRKDAAGVEHTVKIKTSDPVQPGDVIRVKESIF